MQPQFVDRLLACADCQAEFVFTAGEQLFFHDKQFKNDPKRCKPCKSRRSGLSAGASGSGPAAAGIARTETTTDCSECGIQTTVPFKPTQGRPVLCRQCFQAKARALASKSAGIMPPPIARGLPTVSALQGASANSRGATLSTDAAVGAAASMAAASPRSSVATASDLASITPGNASRVGSGNALGTIPAELAAAAANGESIAHAQDLHALAAEAYEA